ncbi:hypothetical protein [Halalkalibaculum sp. DA384]|uniref:hypothetical protein n=1 Tax=Halalkalibaculum sp. DA384 TaxID=3373606 RepID=UPI003753FE6C
MQEDPMELNNLYGQPEYAQRTRELKERLRGLRTQYRDTTGPPIQLNEDQSGK